MSPASFTLGEVRCAVPAGDHCGEGVLWHPDEQAVYWTDINRFLIHRWSPRHDCVKSWIFDEPVTAVLLTDRPETLIVVLGSGAILWQPLSGKRGETIFRLKDWPSVRLNDAGVDPGGRLWVGSMRNNVGPDGSSMETGGSDGVLYRIDPDGAASEWVTGVTICNTIVWSPDRSRFYFADSERNTLDVYQFNQDTGEIHQPTPFFNSFARGLPDGSTLDSQGFLWNCRYGGSCIVRLDPAGTIERVVELPTRNITNCTFGGSDLSTLYVTSAGTGPGDRFGGSLFAILTEFTGQPENRFRLGN